MRLCFICGKSEYEIQIERHHIIPRKVYSPIDSNIIHVCNPRHRAIHQNGLRPHNKTWKKLKTLVKGAKTPDQLNRVKIWTMNETIVSRSKSILKWATENPLPGKMTYSVLAPTHPKPASTHSDYVR